MTAQFQLPAQAQALAEREVQNLLNEVDGVSAVVIATVDGFDVASAMRTGDAARVAAMASSIAAISTVVSQEAELGRNKSVTINTESGFALVYNVHRTDTPLVINVIANGSAILAQVNYRTAQLAQALAGA